MLSQAPILQPCNQQRWLPWHMRSLVCHCWRTMMFPLLHIWMLPCPWHHSKYLVPLSVIRQLQLFRQAWQIRSSMLWFAGSEQTWRLVSWPLVLYNNARGVANAPFTALQRSEVTSLTDMQPNNPRLAHNGCCLRHVWMMPCPWHHSKI